MLKAHTKSSEDLSIPDPPTDKLSENKIFLPKCNDINILPDLLFEIVYKFIASGNGR